MESVTKVVIQKKIDMFAECADGFHQKKIKITSLCLCILRLSSVRILAVDATAEGEEENHEKDAYRHTGCHTATHRWLL